MDKFSVRNLFLAALLGASFGVACSVAFEDAENLPVETFPCNSDEDCRGENQICDKEHPNTPKEFAGVCAADDSDEAAECIDKDGDGYGANEDDRSQCPACKNKDENKNGCDKDCDDDNKDVHPGRTETCNGTDDNCNDETDEPVPCEGPGDCSALAGSQDQDGTSFECKDVNGDGETKQCVVVGDNQTASEQCQEAHGTCKDDGTYSKVPEECTMF